MEERERRYYERRAPEYDDWWLGTGRFRGVERPGWEEERAELERLVSRLPAGRVLDVACGTGFLTRHLPGAVVGLDQSHAMLRLAAERVPDAAFVRADALDVPFADGSFDLVFTSHFYGHLRPGEREAFVAEARRVAPGLVVVDSASRPDAPDEEDAERVLSDGSRHRVYKRRFRPAELADELGGGDVLMAGEWFVAVAA